MTTRWLADLAGTLDGTVWLPGSAGYTRSTTPRNATGHQAPVAVAAVTGPGDISACIRAAAAAGVNVAVQATGHGAAGDLNASTMVVDTSALDTVEVDPVARVVRAGAGATFGAINAAAWRFGLLGLAGTAPGVGVAGYTFAGGVGWLTRPHGLAAATLRRVDWVDGNGAVRRTDDTDHGDTDALWAFRGGGGVGVASALELSVVPAADLWAGYLLWPATQLAEVADAWAAATAQFDPALTTSLALLRQVPDMPGLPASLRGHPAVHLCAASTAGARAGAALQDILDRLPAAVVDTRGPCDAARLSGIHLDPPGPVPALGEGRWLTDRTTGDAHAILGAAGICADSALAEVELRHVAARPSGDDASPAVSGALTSCPGTFLLHATGPAADPDTTSHIEQNLTRVRDAAKAADTGRAASAFCDGRPNAPDTHDNPTRKRLTAIRGAADPDGVIRAARNIA